MRDPKAARETQLEQLRFLSGVADSLPVVGHIKGAIHYGVGDKESGDNAMKSASRTTASIGGAVGGFFVGGPVGSALGAASAGYAMDGITTGVHSAVDGKFRPSGIVAAGRCVAKDTTDPGRWFDFVAPVAMDAIAVGIAAAAQPRWRLEQKMGKNATEIAMKGRGRMKDLAKSGRLDGLDGENVMAIAYDKKTGMRFDGHNKAVRDRLGIPDLKPDPLLPGARTACAEFHALQKAKEAIKVGAPIDPNNLKVVTLHEVKGGRIEVMQACGSCQKTTTRNLNVVTDVIRRKDQSNFRIPDAKVTHGCNAAARTVGATAELLKTIEEIGDDGESVRPTDRPISTGHNGNLRLRRHRKKSITGNENGEDDEEQRNSTLAEITEMLMESVSSGIEAVMIDSNTDYSDVSLTANGSPTSEDGSDDDDDVYYECNTHNDDENFIVFRRRRYPTSDDEPNRDARPKGDLTFGDVTEMVMDSVCSEIQSLINIDDLSDRSSGTTGNAGKHLKSIKSD